MSVPAPEPTPPAFASAWVDVDDVAADLGIDATDTRLTGIVSAADTYCKRQRNDLDPATAPPGDVSQAVRMYAAHLWRRKASSSGGTYNEFAAFEGNETMTEVYRLLGSRKPRAR